MSYYDSGGLAEWSIAAVLKTAVPQGTVGSNPMSSAIFLRAFPKIKICFLLETWESGLIQRLAKASYLARGTVSSNLTVSAILDLHSQLT